MFTAESIPASLTRIIADATEKAGGWQGFDAFMGQALYTPGLGYYANGLSKFGQMPQGLRSGDGVTGAGSDFVTAPEMTPLFGQALARQVAQVLRGNRNGRGLGVRSGHRRAGPAVAGGAG